MSKLYYSTVPYMKFFIQKTYFNDIHYVWCSEMFDNKNSSPHTPGTLVPPSSNPCDIYRELKDATTRKDTHNAKIISQKASLQTIALKKKVLDEITDLQYDEIIYMLDHCDHDFWRPVLYVIPKLSDPNRIKSVPIAKRASFGPEYIIADLQAHDFDMIEV